MKQIKTALGGMAMAMAVAVAGCGGGGGGEVIIPQTPTPTATPTPVATTDFVDFVHKLFAETSDTTQPADINDLNFSHLDAGPNAFDDLLK